MEDLMIYADNYGNAILSDKNGNILNVAGNLNKSAMVCYAPLLAETEELELNVDLTINDFEWNLKM